MALLMFSALIALFCCLTALYFSNKNIPTHYDSRKVPTTRGSRKITEKDLKKLADMVYSPKF